MNDNYVLRYSSPKDSEEVRTSMSSITAEEKEMMIHMQK
jgi:hypothetical protein